MECNLAFHGLCVEQLRVRERDRRHWCCACSTACGACAWAGPDGVYGHQSRLEAGVQAGVDNAMLAFPTDHVTRVFLLYSQMLWMQLCMHTTVTWLGCVT
jgi:hypothetical protein